MKRLGETRAIEMLRERREAFRAQIAETFEHRAKPCSTCETRGACCTDEHFVNVRITRLEAAAIRRAVDKLTDEKRIAVRRRAEAAIERFGLKDGGERFACPLFEPSDGCLVHAEAKPFPCIQHACYERRADVPPDELLDEAELFVHRLNLRVYGARHAPLPLPLALARAIADEA
ncbi:MAG: hypothetical protein ACK4S4_07290 [Pyrinomonadaceae bacterium]